MSNIANAHEEPNLVPLLDLVLQLVMFFMMCTTFRMEEVEQSIRLPVAQSAKPNAEAKNNDIQFLNVNSEGHVIAPGEPKPAATEEEIVQLIRRVYETAKARAV